MTQPSTPTVDGIDPSSLPVDGIECTSSDLTSQTLRGLKWTYLATALGAVLQVGATATMSRLVSPSAYGIIAAANLFLRFGSYFSEMGIGQALIQKPSLSDLDVRAAFTASSAISIVMALIMWCCAPLSRSLLNNADIVPVARVLAVSLALSGMGSTSLALLRRRLSFGTLASIEVVSFAISYGAVGIPLAFAHYGVWAVTAAIVSQPLVTLCLGYLSTRYSLKPSFDWHAHRELLGYGSALSATSFAEFLFFLADLTFVGKVWGDRALGVYSRSSLIANLLIQNASVALMKVLFPAFSRAHTNTRPVATAYLQGLTALALITLPLAFGMIPAAPDIVVTILGSQYDDAVALVQILALSVPLGLTASFAAMLLNVKGVMRQRLYQQVGLSILMWLMIWRAAPLGLTAIAAISVAIQGVRFVAFQNLACRAMNVRWSDILSAHLPGIRLATPVALSVLLVVRTLPAGHHLFRLIVEVGIASLVSIVFAIWVPPAALLPLIIRIVDSIPLERRLPAVKWYRSHITARMSVPELA